jgi:hypothetical protein
MISVMTSLGAASALVAMIVVAKTQAAKRSMSNLPPM